MQFLLVWNIIFVSIGIGNLIKKLKECETFCIGFSYIELKGLIKFNLKKDK